MILAYLLVLMASAAAAIWCELHGQDAGADWLGVATIVLFVLGLLIF